MTPLPEPFLRSLEGADEILVTSRDERGSGTVRTWFAVAPPGVVYLFSHSFSRKAVRWRRDPWVRLRLPGTAVAAEGVAHFVTGAEVDEVAPLVVDRWDMAGATTVEALHRMLDEGTHVLVRVEAAPG